MTRSRIGRRLDPVDEATLVRIAKAQQDRRNLDLAENLSQHP